MNCFKSTLGNLLDYNGCCHWIFSKFHVLLSVGHKDASDLELVPHCPGFRSARPPPPIYWSSPSTERSVLHSFVFALVLTLAVHRELDYIMCFLLNLLIKLTASVLPISANRCFPFTIFRSTSFNILWQYLINSSSYCCLRYEYGAFSNNSLASSSCTFGQAPKSALVLTNKSWGQNFTKYSLQNWNTNRNWPIQW